MDTNSSESDKKQKEFQKAPIKESDEKTEMPKGTSLKERARDFAKNSFRDTTAGASKMKDAIKDFSPTSYVGDKLEKGLKKIGNKAQNAVLFHGSLTAFKIGLGIAIIIACISLFSTRDICSDNVGSNILDHNEPDLVISPADQQKVLYAKDGTGLYTDGNEIEIRIMGRYYPWGYGFGSSDMSPNDKECSFSTVIDGKNYDDTPRRKVHITDVQDTSGGQQVCYLARGAALYMRFLGNNGEPIWYQLVDEHGKSSANNNGTCQSYIYKNNCFDEANKKDKRTFTFVFHKAHPEDAIPVDKIVAFKIAHFRDGAAMFASTEEDRKKEEMPDAKGEYELYIMRGFVDESGKLYQKASQEFGSSIVNQFKEFIYGKSSGEEEGFVITAYRQLVRSPLNRIVRLMMILSLIFFGFNIILGTGQLNHKELLMKYLKLAICLLMTSPSDTMDYYFRTYIIFGTQNIIDALVTISTKMYEEILNNATSGATGSSWSMSATSIIGTTSPTDWLTEVNMALKVLIDEAFISKVAAAFIGYFPLGIGLAYLAIMVLQKVFMLCIKVIILYSSILLQLGLLLSFTAFMIPFILFDRTMGYFTNWINKIKNLFIELTITVLVSKISISLSTALYLDFINSIHCTSWLSSMLKIGLPPIVSLFIIGVCATLLASNPWIAVILAMFSGGQMIMEAFEFKESAPILLGLKTFGIIMIISLMFDKCLQIAASLTGGSQSGAASQVQKIMGSEGELGKIKALAAKPIARIKAGE